MTVYAIVAMTIALTCAGIAFYFKAYRLLRQEKPGQPKRLSKEYTLWERGRLPINVNQDARSGLPELGRRGFLPRLAFGLLCAITARSAARGDALPAVEDFLTTTGLGHAPNTPPLPAQCSHNDLSINHIDVTGPDGSHADRPASHSDHTDCPHNDQPKPPPHNDQPKPPPHNDQPKPPPHVDTPHVDHHDVAGSLYGIGSKREE